eukprot:m.18151 g.18151  ORF g.18151 m.18151 type:complete len:252 (-) comp8258_c0_seq1:176-931(-)
MNWTLIALILAVIVPLRLYLESLKKQYKWIIDVYKCIFFAFAAVHGYIYLHDKIYYPKYFGGPGEETLFVIYTEEDSYLEELYAVGFCYHFHNALVAVLYGDTTAMIIHHIVTLGLIVASNLTGILRIGGMVLLVHNIPDVFISLVKAVKNSGIAPLVYTTAILAIIMWPVFRLYFLGRLTYDTYENLHFSPAAHFGFVFGLSALVVLHSFWYVKLLNIFFNYKSSGKVYDSSEYAEVKAHKEMKKEKKKE